MTLEDALFCDRRIHCRPCRTSARYRAGLVRRGLVRDVDFACPFGVTTKGLKPAGGFTKALASSRDVIVAGGPGAMLKRLLGFFLGIHASPSCSCNRRAAQMDHHGPWWCLRNGETIVGWLRQEADRRHLDFDDAGARLLILISIALSIIL